VKKPEAWERLLSVGWLSQLDEGASAALLDIAQVREVQPDESVFLMGEEDNGLHGLVEGFFDCHLGTVDSMARLVFLAGSGCWFGDGAILSGTPRRGHIIARTTGSVLTLPANKLKPLATQYPEIWRGIGTNLLSTFDNLALLTTTFATVDPVQRVALTLARLVRFNHGINEFPITQSDLAEMSGIARNATGRAIAALKHEGLVSVKYRKVKVPDPDKLYRRVGLI
jgi:CRP/FNR family cyclic AMP-dependent transcriptional regulator